MTEDHVPTVKEELNRKAFETLEGLLLARDQERINDDQLDVAVDAIFGVVGGMADDPLLEAIGEIKLHDPADLQGPAPAGQGSALYLIERLIGAGKVIVNMATQPFNGEWLQTQTKDYSEEVVPDARRPEGCGEADQDAPRQGIQGGLMTTAA